MPQFTYQPYSSRPWAGTIGELMLRPAEIEASRSIAVANANARAAEASGDIWGRSMANVGQLVANLPQQMQQQKVAAQENEIRGMQLDEAKRAARSRNIFEAELRNPANYAEDGTIDDAKIADRLKKQDVGAWQQWSAISAANQKNRLDLINTGLQIQKSTLDVAEKQRAWDSARTAYLGNLAFHGERVLGEKPDDPLHVRDTVLASVARAAADGAVSPEEAKSFLMQTASAGPDQLKQVFGSFVTPEVRKKNEAEIAAQAKMAAETATATANAAKATAEAANLQKWGSTTRPNFEQKNVTLDGKPNQLVNFDPRTGQMFLPGSTEPIDAARVRGNVPASVIIRNEKERTATTNRAELAAGVVTGDIAPSQLSRRAEDYNATLADARRIYRERTGKELNLAKLETDYQGARRFVGSMNGQQMIRYRGLAESVVNTMNEVQRLGDLLQQSGVQKWNSVKRSTIRQIYGNTPESEIANQYVGAINTLKEEFANLANGGYAPTEDAWKLANDQINGDFGFKDLRASLTEVQRLINYRTQAFQDLTPWTGGGRSGGGPSAPSGPKNDPLGLFGGK